MKGFQESEESRVLRMAGSFEGSARTERGL